jgi:iron complex outermembrane receptor protein
MAAGTDRAAIAALREDLMKTKLWAKASIFALAAGAVLPAAAAAQGVDALKDEVYVTGTKKANAENVQDVPLAVTAYGDAQLDALKVRDLQSLSYKIPNVQLEDVGTSRGVANFSIRGLGINSSIPSIDPAVGLFVDGVYIGQNGGQVLDIFDLDSVEVLRGPQGILFGRNVTGGAVVINTKRPNLNEFEASFKGAVESGMHGGGLNYYAMGSVSGPLIEDNLALKVSAYYNNDEGYFRNYLGGPNLVADLVANGGGTLNFLQGAGYPIAVNMPDAFEDFGKAETWMIRPSLLWAPSDSFELLVRYEHGDSTGDGPAAQNHPGLFPGYDTSPGNVAVPPSPNVGRLFSADKNSFTFSINEPGFYDFSWDAVTAEMNIDVGENGRITNIFGWRDSSGQTLSDIDATPFSLFHAGSISEYNQISNELRYNGQWGDALNVTFGLYYFTSDNNYEEQRYLLANRQTFFGGGMQDARQFGVFGQVELNITDELALIGGGRYTNERKSADIWSLVPPFTNPPPPGAVSTCSIYDGSCGVPDFSETRTWRNFTPKLGFQWDAREDLNVYFTWTEGVRSGGYNFRNTAAAIPIASFDEENVQTFEFGFKAQPDDGRATINLAVFRTDIDDMQREVNLPDPVAGVVQLIRNTANASIFGVELEAQYFLTDNLLLTGTLGRLDGEYKDVFFNLNSDFLDVTTGGATTTGIQNLPLDTDIVDARDLRLQIPRLAPWTWGAGFIHNMSLGGLGDLSTRFSYSHRDPNAYTDNNLGMLNGAEILDASIALTTFSDTATISLYGQNLLDEVTHGGETQLPAAIGGGSFAPLNKGRIVGIELQLHY